MTDAVLVSQAYAFAAARHTDQRRKGDREEPYINHLVEVAALVAAATAGKELPILRLRRSSTTRWRTRRRRLPNWKQPSTGTSPTWWRK